MPVRPSDLTCPSCGAEFRRPSNRGRLPRFCSPSCRSSAYRARTAVRTAVPPEHDEAAAGIAEETLRNARELVDAARSRAPDAPVELVHRAVALRLDAEDMLAVAVRKARSHGVTWAQIGTATSMAAGSARGHWSADQVARVLERRRRRAAARARGVPAPSTAGPERGAPGPVPGAAPGNGTVPGAGTATGPGTGVLAVPAPGTAAVQEPGAGRSGVFGDAAAGPGAVPSTGAARTPGRRPAPPRAPARGEGRERRAAEQLTLAMGHLRESRRTSARALARRIGVSASYLSLVLAGKRLPSWDVTRSFAEACGADPDDLADLWCQAHGTAPAPPRSPSEGRTAIRTALRGLYLAAAEPDLPALGGAVQGITGDHLACLVDPSAPPPADRAVIARLVTALGGRDEDVQRLWWQASALVGGAQVPLPGTAPGLPAIPAAAFG